MKMLRRAARAEEVARPIPGTILIDGERTRGHSLGA